MNKLMDILLVGVLPHQKLYRRTSAIMLLVEHQLKKYHLMQRNLFNVKFDIAIDEREK